MRIADHDWQEAERYLLRQLPQTPTSSMTEGGGRRRVARLLEVLGDPQNDLRVVHVAGTAGKGSVCTITASILHQHGFHVGTYLSPHVYSILERFQLDTRPAPAQTFGAALELVRHQQSQPGGLGFAGLTMFEVATAAAFVVFRDQKVDYAVVETGIGGLHDASNTVTRRDKLAVLTTIGLDHTSVLGETVSEIAGQKAGILPLRGAAVAIRGCVDADDVVVREAARRRCALDHVTPEQATGLVPPGAVLGLVGEHQRINAGLAIRAVSHLAARDGWVVEPDLVRKGLAAASLPGRFERRMWNGHEVILDGAHNALKIQALVRTVERQWPARKPVWVVACKFDRNVVDTVRPIGPLASAVIATEFDSKSANEHRDVALPADQVAEAARMAGVDRVLVSPRLATALSQALALAGPYTPIVVTGSFYAVAGAESVMSR